MASLANEDVSYSRVADLVEKDTVMAGQVLRIVNSPIYGFRSTITSVRHAVCLMGHVKLRNTVLGLSIANLCSRVKTPAQWSAKRFNLHSVATALLADIIAQKTPTDYAEGAFTGGLLHDFGKLLIAVGLPKQFEEICRLYKQGGKGFDECEWDVLGWTHAQFSAAALTQWNLPVPIQEAVLFHHAPEPRLDRMRDLAEVIYTANRAVNLLGISVIDPPEPLQGTLPAILEEFGCVETAAAISTEFEAEFGILKSFF